MSTVQLVYVSEPVEDIRQNFADFKTLCEKNNAEHGITGILLASKCFHIQVIEGERLAVNQLYRNIVRDHRHRHCTIIRYIDTHFRDFTDWSIIYATLEELSNIYMNKTIADDELSYKNITGVQAMCVIRRLEAYFKYVNAA